MNIKTQKIVSLALSILGSIGTIATAVMVAKETPEAKKKLDEIKEKKDHKKLDEIFCLAKSYTPAILIGAATIVSNASSIMISRRTEASLSAAALIVSQGWQKYKYKVKDVLGNKANELINEKISEDDYKKDDKVKEISEKDGDKLYWEEHLGFFKCNEIDLITAISDANQRLHCIDPEECYFATTYWVNLEAMMHDAKAIILSRIKLDASKNFGWTYEYLLDNYGIDNIWIHPQYTRVIDRNTKELKYTKISFREDPIFLNVFTKKDAYGNLYTEDDLMHNAEMDMTDTDVIDVKEIVYGDENVSAAETIAPPDGEDGFATSNIHDPSNVQIRYLDGSDPDVQEDEAGNPDTNLPDPKLIPTM